MVKILSQAGTSLADLYDVEGSVAGIDQLETRDLPIVHDMSGTLFSERCSGFVRRMVTGDILQNVTWDIVLDDLPAGLVRVLGFIVMSDTIARTTLAQLSMRDPGTGREVPFFQWHSTNDLESIIRIVENGAAVGNQNMLINVSEPPKIPNLLISAGQPQRVQEIAFRGIASAFGAGTVEITALVYLAFSAIGGVPGNTTSRGIPIPGW